MQHASKEEAEEEDIRSITRRKRQGRTVVMDFASMSKTKGESKEGCEEDSDEDEDYDDYEEYYDEDDISYETENNEDIKVGIIVLYDISSKALRGHAIPGKNTKKTICC